MNKIKNNFVIILLSFLIVSVCCFQIMMLVAPNANYSQVIQKNKDRISTVFQTASLHNNFENEYFKMHLPTGMNIYAIENNNAKIRYNQTYIDLHVLTSKIDINTYSQSNFPTAQKFLLPQLNGEQVFVLIQEREQNIVDFALYTKQLEIIATIQNTQLEETLLKSIELLKNIKVQTDVNNEFFIGGNGNANEFTEKSNNNIDITGDEDDNKEIPVIKN